MPEETHTLVDIELIPLEETTSSEEKSISVDISDEVVKQLRNLKSLYDEILTEEEYQEKKAQILGKK